MKDKGYIRRVATEFVDIARRKGNRFLEIEEEMGFFLSIMKNRRIEVLLSHPHLSLDEKRSLMNEAIGPRSINKEVLSLVYLLLEEGRIGLLGDILEEYRDLSHKAQGLKEVFLKTAIPIDDGTRERLRASFEGLLGSKVILKIEVDSGLIGGIVARIGDKVIDGSLLTTLSKMRDELTR